MRVLSGTLSGFAENDFKNFQSGEIVRHLLTLSLLGIIGPLGIPGAKIALEDQGDFYGFCKFFRPTAGSISYDGQSDRAYGTPTKVY